MLLFLISCYDNTYPRDLAVKQNIVELVSQGWLPEEFVNLSIKDGIEIHNLDTNNIWGYLVTDEFNITEDCIPHPFTNINYKKPPKSMKDKWLSKNDFVKLNKYLCNKFGRNFIYLFKKDKIFFMRYL